MSDTSIEKSLNKLISYIELQNFKGFDPYDTLNSFIPFSFWGKWISAIAVQFQKRNPINIRHFIGIKKDYNPKGMGLFLKSYVKLYRITGNDKYKNHADFLFEWLINNYSKGYSGYAWGYNFNWANPGGVVKAYTPSSVVTSFVIDGIMEYYLLTKNEKAKDIILSAADYIHKDLPVTKLENGISIAYTHLSKGCCYNASLLGAETLAKAYYLSNNNDYIQKAQKAVNYVTSMQYPDGHWNYSYNPENKSERKQIDFHQGFVLISLNQYLLYSKDNNPLIKEAIEKGLNYYENNQFHKNGSSLRRVPRVWPIDIHNQSQGIITFSELTDYSSNNLDFAKRIANYTISKMQNKKGYFYYQKHKYFTNKIPYIRWGQAWMLLALTVLLEKIHQQ